MKANGLEPLVETPDDVEDERAVGDGLAEVAEVLCLARLGDIHRPTRRDP
jgi:hypothetical protein